MSPADLTSTVKCKLCEKIFSNRSNCMRHMRNAHMLNLNNSDPIQDRHTKSFVCVFCDKTFAAKQNLDNHMNAIHLLNSQKSKCSMCSFETVYQRNLKRHILKVHNSPDSSKVCPIQKFQCTKCPAKFRESRKLKYHERKIHNFGEAMPTRRKCPLCTFTSTKRKKFDIYNHFENIHNVQIRKKKYTFDSLEEFNLWKNATEKETATSYIRSTTTRSVSYLRCHRSGYYNPKGLLKRHIKMSGSCKINGFCPASITVKEVENNKVHVCFISTHVGHKNDLKYLRLSREEKRSIALQLANKKPHEEILKSIRGSITNLDLHRFHLTNKKDIVNIEKSFNLHDESIKHPFDPISIASWVTELSNSGKVSLIVYKPQGIEDPQFPNLKADDFLLLFMTEAQKIMLKKYGHDTICIDGTHGLNSYDFQLYTLLVLDDTREGFPVAFMFTNRGDEVVIQKFFESIKSVTGLLKTKVFMSDMEETFFSAWTKHMCVPEHRIFCSWHVLKAWRANINKKIKSDEKRQYTQNLLRMLMYELDVYSFHKLLSKSLTIMNEDKEMKSFFEYFNQNYVQNERFKLWAYCYRVHAGVNTNMSVENFNRLLKYCYLRGKQVRRLDKTLCVILNLLRDKIFDLLIKMKRGKLVRKLQLLRKRHKNSFSIELDFITKTEEMWVVLSAEKTEFYTVKKVKDCKTCQLRCLHCDSCFHEYICSCIDSSVKNNMCKHIHAVAKSEFDNKPNEKINAGDNNGQLIVDCEQEEQEDILAQVSQNSDKNITLEEFKLKLKKKFDYLENNIKSTDQATFVENEVNKIITTLGAMDMPTTSGAILTVKRSIPSNTNIISQRKFKSTKKSKKVKNLDNKGMEGMQKLALELLGYK